MGRELTDEEAHGAVLAYGHDNLPLAEYLTWLDALHRQAANDTEFRALAATLDDGRS